MFYCVELVDYQNDNTAPWYCADKWAIDLDGAATEFVEEEVDYHKNFGTGERGFDPVAIMVYDDQTKVTTVIHVTPDPQPGYSYTTLDDTNVEYEHMLDPTRMPKPNDL